MGFIKQLEKKIIGKINKLKNAETKAEGISVIKEAEINKSIERLRQSDEASAEELNARYLEAVKENAQKD